MAKYSIYTDLGLKKGTDTIFSDLYDEIVADGNFTFEYLQTKEENKKLQKTEEIIYIIWNLPYYITCPNATEACKIACYAGAPENNFMGKNTKPYRYRNLAECTGDNAETFVDRMIKTIDHKLASNAYKGKTVRVRIHESGDFFSKEYAMQWLQIAMHFIGNESIVFMAYTKSFAFFDGVELPENFVIRASVWQDTKEKDLETIKRNNWPLYMAIPASLAEYAKAHGYITCDCENCSTCKDHCFTRNNKLMYVVLHGADAKKLESDSARVKQIIDMFSTKEEKRVA